MVFAGWGTPFSFLKVTVAVSFCGSPNNRPSHASINGSACLTQRAADILNPDICAIGGISALMDISVMAEPQAVVMSPHNYNSHLIGMAATVHVSAVIPNFKITEYFVNFEDRCREIATQRLTRDGGWLDLPTAPGLSIDIDVARLRAHPHQEATKHGFRQYWEEYPRKGYVPKL